MNGSGGSSAALLRRHSSKQGLQNLLRLTTQWSVEDEEEAARERRRRERERQLRSQSEDGPGGTSSCPEMEPEQPEQEKLLALKPMELEEDEGFSDWSQKMEQRKQRWGPDGSLDGGETSQEESPEYEDRAEGSSHRSYEEEEEEEDPPLSQTQASLSQLCVDPVPWPEEAARDIPEEETGLLEMGSCLRGQAETEDRKVFLKAAHVEEEEEERQSKAPSPSGLEAREEQDPPPLSPTTKLIDRTESLNRSIKKSNSVKKSQPALPVSKIDDRLEQYTQAIETAGKTPKLSRQPSVEMPAMTVASSKNLWETGEFLAQSSAKTPPCKDIVAGDMSKRSFWEHKGGSKTSSTVKSTPSGKRYKFVATGHGKYEKVLVDDAP
ncbi:lymphocyte-specific protein 1 isoform X2 [Phascolarctos cinereus]|uniref:Lymphocyte-specific protein 1 isoform X2 n=1 Tax=Phascolarctos cinereus TaxID=38626 RepID=A0A6P5J5I2_PHACI|nr:lymphocyte-specific protein 1 isoform X2 [Phascolarctos cinereus]